MKKFLIPSNEFLNQDTLAFYHFEYYGGGGRWKIDGSPENIICTLKNDITPFSEPVLQLAQQRLGSILLVDLPEILRFTKLDNLTVCVIPRAKVNYRDNQLLFKATINEVLTSLNGFSNGINSIVRHRDTRTTHRNKAGFGGNGDLPYPGITVNTCKISNNITDKDILLIDDLYTAGINIDEDAIQALLDRGAKSVIFYSVGRTV